MLPTVYFLELASSDEPRYHGRIGHLFCVMLLIVIILSDQVLEVR